MTSDSKLYEISYFLDADSEDKAREISDRVRNFLEEKNPVITAASHLQNRRLAYPIRKKTEGTFGSIKFLLHPDGVSELRDFLNREKNVLRYVLALSRRAEETPRPPRRSFQKRVEEKHADEAVIDKKLEEILGA